MIIAAQDGLFLENEVFANQLPAAILETIFMTAATGIIVALLGLPLGIALHNLGPKGLAPRPKTYRVVSILVDIGRSIPFIVLMISLIPFTRFMVGTALGWQAAVVPLSVGAIPFFARLVENALREVDAGKVEAVKMMGASSRHIMRQVQVREALPGIVGGFTVTLVALISYTAMAGAVGGGGLGALAYNYGYQRYQGDTMLACVVLLVIIVAILQWTGDRMARTIDHR
ncbi:methionine ABC transporter permease [Nesterenkonia sp. F]|uniref:methionine ABC transporter permease n=1 Tax=Nesterenkonia sp. F TaxID=795955 RepID=UPI000255CF76